MSSRVSKNVIRGAIANLATSISNTKGWWYDADLDMYENNVIGTMRRSMALKQYTFNGVPLSYAEATILKDTIDYTIIAEAILACEQSKGEHK